MINYYLFLINVKKNINNQKVKNTEEIKCGLGKYEYKYHEQTGWLHKDGMTVCFIP